MKKLSKQFGVLVIKFQDIKRKIQLIKRLEKREINRLVVEGIITIVAMVLIYLGALYLFQKMIYQNSANIAFVWRLIGINEDVIRLAQQVFTVMMIVITIWLTNWRLSRRYHQIELQHILRELDFIAQGHYDHRISLDGIGKLQSVAKSINGLVDNAVRAMEEERHIEKTKQELITNVSHDIRTPLTSIIGYLALIREKQFDSTEDLMAYVEIAYQKSHQMKVLADNLFEYATMQSSADTIQKQSVSLSNFLSQLAAEFDLEMKENGMELCVELSQPDLTASLDPNKMVRVFTNIFSNAFKYSQASKIIVSAITENGGVLIKISNNGLPIEPEAMSKLFVRFYRENNERNNKLSGSGLGLAIVETIVVAHGGKVTVTSTTDETAFYIWLPNDETH